MSLNGTLAGSWVIGTWRKCIPTTVGARISAQIRFLHPLRMTREARMGNIAEMPHIPCLGFLKINEISLPLDNPREVYPFPSPLEREYPFPWIIYLQYAL